MRKYFLGMLKFLGMFLCLFLLWFVAGVLWPLDVPASVKPSARLLITNANVIDVETGQVNAGNDILIADGTIVAVGSGLTADGAEVLNADGAYAMPGMFDMHAHSIKMSPALMHPLFIAAGVTAIRDINGCIGIEDPWVACADEKRFWNTAVQAGEMISPRYDQVTSLAMNGGSEVPGALDPALGGANAEGAIARVKYDKARGIDYLKTYNGLPRDAYFALAKAAQDNDMYIAGHLPFSVSGIEAVTAGQRSFEHALLFIFECYPGMDGLRSADDFFAQYTYELRLKMIAEHDSTHCKRLQNAMVVAGAAFVPTHTTRKLDAYALDPNFRSDARLKYIPAPLRMLWLNDADGMARRAGEGGQESYKAIYQFGLQQTGIAHKAGVTVLAGTDTPDSFAFPGLGLADELDHFIQAGLSPLDAVRAATIEPAKFLGLEGVAGVVKAGARADVVLLRNNPLENIDAVKAVQTVVLAGAVYERQQLDAMLARVEGNANHWSMWPKFVWQIIRSPIMRKQFAD